ncbi:polysaccharide biosynthesis C-terminal domain-containing protein [Mycolicibacterium aichiense]|uniref:Membrane protein involved in the export of O-antigen and teichoic acid n=1 Tax=Mycolicibacterium aichiense TaxID=1799 RepID=A0AAD1MED6_9MYCO|nr:polysaccharide biosynthesis C-terminal domain-containing protein [Mycolicibacterium aichiense]MCV7016385.1 oligosaccharide flippase family protein [Mycolicibacterium aichiense]BBX09841.1 hypothetical protein MAIC_46440 [Mycolicibacterium aichiense]STZ26490.1 membrane protein involved in the export of O-antigen and teichoic acid [Mycolicibacterium aichiense]
MSVVARGVAISAAGYALPPAAVLITQIMIAQGLGVEGRGEVAAAMAPLTFALALLTIGLPESLTFYVARGAGHLARILGISLGALGISGLTGSFVLVILARPLSGGDPSLAGLIATVSAALVPGLFMMAFRGVALGACSWWLVAAERTVCAFIPLVAVAVLLFAGSLTAYTATLALAFGTFVGAGVYLLSPGWWAVVRAPAKQPDSPEQLPKLHTYAWQSWMGVAGGLVIMRLDQVVMTPLAGVNELGIYVVAVNVTSVALLFNMAVKDVMFAVESGERDAERVGRAARLSTLVTAIVGAVLAAASPWAIPALFGPGFAPAAPLAAILILASVLGNPGSVAGAALSARGRPGLRSLALAIGMAIYLVPMFLLIKSLGALGAALAMLVVTTAPACLCIYWLHKYYGVPPAEFYRFRMADIRMLFNLASRLLTLRRA